MKINRLLLLCVCPLLILTGCMSLPSKAPLNTWQGRFSVTVKDVQGNHNERGRFEFLVFPGDETVLDLKSPIGGTIARIEKSQDVARLQALGHETIQAQDVNTLMTQTLGFTVPVEGLIYWINGEPDPRTPSVVTPEQAPISRIEQDGWQIDVLARNEAQQPTRLRLTRLASATEPGIVITLLIQGVIAHDGK